MDMTALFNITYGLYLLNTRDGDCDNGCIINTAVQLAEDPVRIGVSVIKKNKTCQMILSSGVFNVSTVSEKAPFSVFQRFGMQSGRDADKFQDFPHVSRSENGLLYLTKYTNAYYSCKVVEQVDLGTHILFIGQLTDAQVLSQEKTCTYGYYQQHIKPKPAKPVSEKPQWVCTVCGYVYEGEEVPEDYICPLCNHGKDDFVPVTADMAKEGTNRWQCTICGFIYEGDSLPEDYVCPLCTMDSSYFKPLEN
jgi:flavin reductase (DIM6/NTAB) family NADH-FMN oxidoreductase RutF